MRIALSSVTTRSTDFGIFEATWSCAPTCFLPVRTPSCEIR